MDKVKYIINCNGKKIIFNSEEKFEIFKQRNQNCKFIEKERTKENFTINIINVDMIIDNNQIPQPDPKDPTIKELAKTVNGLTSTVNGLTNTVNGLTNTVNDMMKMLTDFIKKQEQFNKKQDQR
jgi:hypothetical protein